MLDELCYFTLIIVTELNDVARVSSFYLGDAFSFRLASNQSIFELFAKKYIIELFIIFSNFCDKISAPFRGTP